MRIPALSKDVFEFPVKVRRGSGLHGKCMTEDRDTRDPGTSGR
jgi:hypothetical protein